MVRAIAQYEVEQDDGLVVVIRDLGPWHRFPTVINDAECVVARLHAEGRLGVGRRLFYWDSEGDLAEIEHDGVGGFLGFKHAEIRS